ncbi:MAG TPA: MFS transporter [Anaerolineae bacterium]
MESSAQVSRLVNRSPVFYGWVIVGAGTLGFIMTSPGQTYAVSIFIEHFIGDLGISRSLVSTLYTAGTLVGSLALPVLGRLIDRKGPRLMVAVIASLFGLACIYMGFVTSAVTLGLGFLAIRMFGQGGLGLVSQYVINQWWVRRRGTIMGISGLGLALLGIGGFPTLINHLITGYGWRLTYPLLGGMVLLVMVPLGVTLFRNQPERFGLLPDGGPSLPAGLVNEPSVPEENWTPAEAMRTLAFWVVTLGVAAIAMLSTGLFFHMVSIFSDNNLSAAQAAYVYAPIAVTTAVVNLASGVLVDRISLRILLAIALLFQALSLWMAQSLDTVALAVIYGIVLGATSGLMRTVSSVAWATYFGRRYLGSISGTASTILIAGSALGPVPLGLARDVFGSYNLALQAFMFLPLLLGAASLFTGRPQKASI